MTHLFDVCEMLFNSLGELGVLIYNLTFTPIRDYLPTVDIPFFSDLIQALPDQFWDTFVGDLTIATLFLSSYAIVYIYIELFKLVWDILDIII